MQLEELATKLSSSLQEKQLKGRTLTLKLKATNFEVCSKALHLYLPLDMLKCVMALHMHSFGMQNLCACSTTMAWQPQLQGCRPAQGSSNHLVMECRSAHGQPRCPVM